MTNPGGKGTVTPYVVARGADAFLDFVETTFEATSTARIRTEDGLIGHAEIRVGDSVLMAFDAKPGWPPTPSFLSVYVEDADAVVARAVAAGAIVVTEVALSRIVGARGGRVRDPVGNLWWLQTQVAEPDLSLFADAEELATMRALQESFDAEMSGRG